MGEHGGPGPRAYGVPESRQAWDSVDLILSRWAEERPDLDFTPVGVVTRMARVRAHLEAGVRDLLAAHQLSSADFQVIVTLRRAGPPFRMAQARLMEALELTSGTISVRVDRLERRHVVLREPDPSSGRATLVRLTDTGLDLFDTVAPAHLANEDRLLSALNSQERTQLADLLRRLLTSFEPHHAEVASALGITLESAPETQRRRLDVGMTPPPGLLVTTVTAGSAADHAGVVRGDVLVSIDSRPTMNAVAVAEALDRTPKRPFRLGIVRGDQPLTLSLKQSP